jgi:hypothetical protein
LKGKINEGFFVTVELNGISVLDESTKAFESFLDFLEWSSKHLFSHSYSKAITINL